MAVSGAVWKLPQRGPGAANHSWDVKVIKIHVPGTNFVSITAQICINRITTEV